MYFSESIILCVPTEDNTKSLAENADAGTQITVFADKKSVKYNEFYQAAQAGLRPEIIFAMWAEEYSGQTVIKDGSSYYIVLRAYEKGSTLELTCAKLEG